MDSTLLRFFLLIVGVLFLVGIYYWDKKKRRQGPVQAKTRELPEIGAKSEPDIHQDSDKWVLDLQDPDNLESELARLTEHAKETEHEQERELQGGATTDMQQPLDKQEELFSFSAKEESPVDVPSKVVQINLIAKQGSFSGPEIQTAVKETGLQAGEMQVYHRYTSDGTQRVTFNMASMVEPGIFPLKAMQEFTTPGLALFAQLPGPGDSLAIFSDMLFTAQRLATKLDGELQDETHSALTKQTIEHIRSQIMEHRRLVQLARSRR